MKYINTMMIPKRIAVCVLLFWAVAVSCASEDALSSESVIGLGKTQQEKTELDLWIEQEITKPYGIEVLYHWDKNNTESGTYNYPPKVEKVQPVLETIKYLLLELYKDKTIGGEDFWKGRNPLKIYLYGGENLDENGKELIGNADAVGREFFIYNVNTFDAKDKAKVYKLMRSVYHQFAKLLVEFYPYDRYKFAQISGNAYISSTSEMFSLNKTANKHGFFTPYSMLSPENDFAEIVSFYLTNPQQEFEKAKENALELPPGTDEELEKEKAKEKAAIAHRCLVEKQKFVEEYFRKEVKISIKRLQLLTLQRMNTYLNK